MNKYFCLTFILIFIGITPTILSAETCTVLRWRGNVKIANKTPVKDQKFAYPGTSVTFEKTCDFLIIKTEKGEVKPIIPTNFSEKLQDCKNCGGPSCKPKVVTSKIIANTHNEFYTEFVKPFVIQLESPKSQTVPLDQIPNNQTPAKKPANKNVIPATQTPKDKNTLPAKQLHKN